MHSNANKAKTNHTGVTIVPALCKPVLVLALALAPSVESVCELSDALPVCDEPPSTAVDVTVCPFAEVGVGCVPLNWLELELTEVGAGRVTTMVEVIADPSALVPVVVIVLVVLDDEDSDVEDEREPPDELSIVLLAVVEDVVDDDDVEAKLDPEPGWTPPASEENKAVVVLPAIPFHTKLTTSPPLAVMPGPRYDSVEPLTTPRRVLPGTWYAVTVSLPSVSTAMPVVTDAGTGPSAEVIIGVPSRCKSVEPAEKT